MLTLPQIKNEINEPTLRVTISARVRKELVIFLSQFLILPVSEVTPMHGQNVL